MLLRSIKWITVSTIIIAVLVVSFLVALTFLFPLRHSVIIRELSEKYDLPKEMVYAVIHTESRFREDARSHRSAAGLMQLMPDTAAWAAERIGMTEYNNDRILEPEINIELGCWYLSWLYIQFDGEWDTVLAAYNAGNGRVSQWLRDPEYSVDGRTLYHIPYTETRNYVQRVNSRMQIYRLLLAVFGRFLP
jgi:soluble lytic murein transglycosylase